MAMIESLLYKKLFLYLLPFNFLVGEYNLGMQYRFNEEWAFDINGGYVRNIEGTVTANLYENLLSAGTFYYQGPVAKVSIISVLPRGPNPLRTDYNQIEVAYRYLSYENLDFEDESEKGKLFNISENMQAISLSWKVGYNLIPRDIFEVNAFVGFGMQLRFKDTFVNSYGYNYHSDQFNLYTRTSSTQAVPLLHLGIKVGLKTLSNKID